MTIRSHMKELHPKHRIPRSNKEASKVHARIHHRYTVSHYHEGINTGPDNRPIGWYTGEGAIPKKD